MSIDAERALALSQPCDTQWTVDSRCRDVQPSEQSPSAPTRDQADLCSTHPVLTALTMHIGLAQQVELACQLHRLSLQTGNPAMPKRFFIK